MMIDFSWWLLPVIYSDYFSYRRESFFPTFVVVAAAIIFNKIWSAQLKQNKYSFYFFLMFLTYNDRFKCQLWMFLIIVVLLLIYLWLNSNKNKETFIYYFLDVKKQQ